MQRVVLSGSDGHRIAPPCVRADFVIKVESHEAVLMFQTSMGIIVRSGLRYAASHRRPNREQLAFSSFLDFPFS